jgi:hypothetical protein
VEFERGVVHHLSGPISKAAGDGQGQLPQAALKPHTADQDAAHENARVRSSALPRIFPPIGDGDPCTRREQQQEQRDEHIFEEAECLVIIGRADEEHPGIKERIRAHRLASPGW